MTDPIFAQMMAADPAVGFAMNTMLQCLCEEAQRVPNPPKNCCFRAGESVVHDLGVHEDQCCEGIAYVSLTTINPTDNFPRPDVIRQVAHAGSATCAITSWAVQMKVGIVRCVPAGGEDPLQCADWNAIALQQVYDAKTLRRAGCCFRTEITTSDGLMNGMGVLIGEQTQTDPQGGCIERNMTVLVQIPSDCEC